MRSACFGARSARSAMTMRPLVLSITIALALSRLAGSGWASAGATPNNAAIRARTRIMKTPLADELGSLMAWSGELGLQGFGDGRRHEGGNIAAHAGDLAHQCGSDRADGDGSRQEHRMHLRRHGLVHAGDLHLVIEVGAVTQAPNHDG